MPGRGTEVILAVPTLVLLGGGRFRCCPCPPAKPPALGARCRSGSRLAGDGGPGLGPAPPCVRAAGAGWPPWPIGGPSAPLVVPAAVVDSSGGGMVVWGCGGCRSWGAVPGRWATRANGPLSAPTGPRGWAVPPVGEVVLLAGVVPPGGRRGNTRYGPPACAGGPYLVVLNHYSSTLAPTSSSFFLSSSASSLDTPSLMALAT